VSHQVSGHSHGLEVLGGVGCLREGGWQDLASDIAEKLGQVVREKSVRFEHRMGRGS
jgi:hypothetical protein